MRRYRVVVKIVHTHIVELEAESESAALNEACNRCSPKNMQDAAADADENDLEVWRDGQWLDPGEDEEYDDDDSR